MQKATKKEPAAAGTATSSKVSSDTISNNKNSTKISDCQEVDYEKRCREYADTIFGIKIELEKLRLALAIVLNDYDFDNPIYSGAYNGAACMGAAALTDKGCENGLKWLSGFDKVMGFVNIAEDYAASIKKILDESGKG